MSINFQVAISKHVVELHEVIFQFLIILVLEVSEKSFKQRITEIQEETAIQFLFEFEIHGKVVFDIVI